MVIEGSYNLSIGKVTTTFFKTKEAARLYLRVKAAYYFASFGGDLAADYLAQPGDYFSYHGDDYEIRPIIYTE